MPWPWLASTSQVVHIRLAMVGVGVEALALAMVGLHISDDLHLVWVEALAMVGLWLVGCPHGRPPHLHLAAATTGHFCHLHLSSPPCITSVAIG